MEVFKEVTAWFSKNATVHDIKKFCEDNSYELEIFNSENFRLVKVKGEN